MDTGGTGEYGRCHTLLHDGFQEQILASEDGPRLATVHCIYCWESGFYEFTHMPFGLCNAPATFQCLMQNMVGELNLTYCVIYLNNVIVFS